VLVVDDQEHMCWVLDKLLSQRGHTVRTANTRAASLGVIPSFDCQVAVVDYRLPDANGISLIVELTARLPKLRAILMTSYGGKSIRQKAEAQPIFAYFDKPFDNDLMIRAVEAAVLAWQAGGDASVAGSRARTLFPE
jgi:two-component system NtrC family response regulator